MFGSSSLKSSSLKMLWLPLSLSEHERNYGLGMDALVTVISLGTRTWMLQSPYSLETRTELWFGHGYSGHRILLETQTELWFGHGCSSPRILLEHERNYGLGMDALVTVDLLNKGGWAIPGNCGGTFRRGRFHHASKVPKLQRRVLGHIASRWTCKELCGPRHANNITSLSCKKPAQNCFPRSKWSTAPLRGAGPRGF